MTELSTEMVRLFKEQFGRGPTSARTVWTGDIVTVVLEDTLTPAERNLVKMGQHERLRETRLFFQYASVSEFCQPVERITGRKVRAYTSAIDTHIDGLRWRPSSCIPSTRLTHAHAPSSQSPDPAPPGLLRGAGATTARR
jgi:uncharacterized protein YbcI